jgi:hypothetical protein
VYADIVFEPFHEEDICERDFHQGIFDIHEQEAGSLFSRERRLVILPGCLVIRRRLIARRRLIVLQGRLVVLQATGFSR